jgi:hypothetical protein
MLRSTESSNRVPRFPGSTGARASLRSRRWRRQYAWSSVVSSRGRFSASLQAVAQRSAMEPRNATAEDISQWRHDSQPMQMQWRSECSSYVRYAGNTLDDPLLLRLTTVQDCNKSNQRLIDVPYMPRNGQLHLAGRGQFFGGGEDRAGRSVFWCCLVA